MEEMGEGIREGEKMRERETGQNRIKEESREGEGEIRGDEKRGRGRQHNREGKKREKPRLNVDGDRC